MAGIFDLLREAGMGSPDNFLMQKARYQEDDEEEEDELYDPAAPIDVFGSRSQGGQPQQAPMQQQPAAPTEPRAKRSFEDDFGSEYEPQERKGRFGTKGVLRDILGTLGDAFLVQGGADAVYQPRREKEKEADAMAGFSRNPLRAIERLAQENREAAQKMWEKYQTNALGMDKLDFARDKFAEEAPDRAALRSGRDATRQRTTLGNARTAIASVSTPEQWAALRPRLQAQLKEQGLDLHADLIPEGYDPDVQYLFMDPKDLAQMEDRDALRNQQAAIARLRIAAQKRGQDLNYSLGKQRNATGEKNAETARRRQEQAGKGKKSFNFGPPPPGIPKPPGGVVRPRN